MIIFASFQILGIPDSMDLLTKRNKTFFVTLVCLALDLHVSNLMPVWTNNSINNHVQFKEKNKKYVN